MIRFIHEIVCRFTLATGQPTPKYDLKVYVTSIAGEVNNWRPTHIQSSLRAPTRGTLSNEETQWANSLEEQWTAMKGNQRPIPHYDPRIEMMMQ